MQPCLGRNPLVYRGVAALTAAAPRAAALAALALAAIGASAPRSTSAGDVSGSVALVSDYVYHGLSLTCGGPAAQAGVQIGTGGGVAPSETFAGVWGSAGLGGGDCRMAKEIDLYAGQRVALSTSQSLTLTYVHYAFPGGVYLYEPIEGRRLDYDELGATWAFEDRLYLSLSATPNALEYRGDYVERARTALSFGGQFHQPISDWFTLSAGAGYDEASDPTGAGFMFWNAGLSRTIGRIEFDVSYYRTAPRAERLFGPRIAGGRVAATAVWRF